MERPKMFLAYNAYTQTFAAFADESQADAFRAHQANCCLMTAVVPVEIYASAADAIAHCKPLPTPDYSPLDNVSRRGGFKRGELTVSAASSGTGKSRMTGQSAPPIRGMKGIDFADAVNALTEDEGD